jgi:hypothetical protein
MSRIRSLLWYVITQKDAYFESSIKVKGRAKDSAVGIVTGYELDGRGFGVQVLYDVKFSSLRHPHRFWGPSSLSDGHWGIIPRE